jgi:RNA polymerase sigma factor (sigma-70 family)
MHNRLEIQNMLLANRTTDNVGELYKMNIGLVIVQLKKFGMRWDSEARSIANNALYNAIMNFDNSKPHHFSTFATVCIYNALGDYVRHNKTKMCINTVSYDAIVSGEDETLTYENVLHNCSIESDEYVIQKLSTNSIKKAFKICFQEMTNDNHKAVVNSWVSSGFSRTQEEIAKELNFSQTYVSQILKKFRTKLKVQIERMRY